MCILTYMWPNIAASKNVSSLFMPYHFFFSFMVQHKMLVSYWKPINKFCSIAGWCVPCGVWCRLPLLSECFVIDWSKLRLKEDEILMNKMQVITFRQLNSYWLIDTSDAISIIKLLLWQMPSLVLPLLIHCTSCKLKFIITNDLCGQVLSVLCNTIHSWGNRNKGIKKERKKVHYCKKK